MSTREKAIQILDTLTEEQLQGFILLFQNTITPNAETISAMQEAEDIATEDDLLAIEEAQKDYQKGETVHMHDIDWD